MIASIGENINLRRMKRLSMSDAYVSSYIHGQVSDGLGKIGVLVSLKSDLDKDILDDIGKNSVNPWTIPRTTDSKYSIYFLVDEVKIANT